MIIRTLNKYEDKFYVSGSARTTAYAKRFYLKNQNIARQWYEKHKNWHKENKSYDFGLNIKVYWDCDDNTYVLDHEGTVKYKENERFWCGWKPLKKYKGSKGRVNGSRPLLIKYVMRYAYHGVVVELNDGHRFELVSAEVLNEEMSGDKMFECISDDERIIVKKT